MATRTTTTRTTETGCVPSADLFALPHADFLFQDLVQAYYDCRKTKRNSASALRFELALEANLLQLDTELRDGSYKPGKSICFVVTHPKHREVWAADFRDRIVHHLLYNHVADRIHRRFIADSCACIPGRGTLYAGQRLEAKMRSITSNWKQPAWYLKCDLANFFVSIDKRILRDQLARHIREPWWLMLAEQILMHDPRQNYELRGPRHLLEKVPAHKRLAEQPQHLGLPIGNLSSQFYANIYLNDLDQFIKHDLRARHYIRYVDDFVLLHKDPAVLNHWLRAISGFLQQHLAAQLNPSKTIIQPIHRGVDFVGHVIKPWRRSARRRTLRHAINRVHQVRQQDLWQTANSYFGMLTQASHSHGDRVRLAKVVLARGKAVNGTFTKTFKGAA